MTKIRNNLAYPFDINISVDDYIIGSDAETPEKVTKNYRVGDLIKFMGSMLGQGTNDYKFSLYVDENSMVPPDGVFFSENNTVPFSSVTYLRFAKVNSSGVDMGVFFSFLESQNIFDLKIRNSSDPNSFAFFSIIGFSVVGECYRLNVSFVSAPAETSLENGANYSIDLSPKQGTGGGGSVNGALTLMLKNKGFQNEVPNIADTLEVGDIVFGFKDQDEFWDSAMYLGGSQPDRNNYIPLVSTGVPRMPI